MDIKTEKKIFLTALWIFLASSLLFFIVHLSLGKLTLPPAVWAGFLILDAGFIIFIFVPLPGRKPAGHPGEISHAKRWYPRKLADIVERPAGEDDAGYSGLYVPGRAIKPVPLFPLILLLILVAIAAPVRHDEDSWKKKEKERLLVIFDGVREKIGLLEDRLIDTGAKVSEIVGGRDLDRLGAPERAALIHSVDSLAVSVAKGLEPFNELGIQVFSPAGERVIWGGVPRIRQIPNRFGVDTLIYTGRTQLYTLLVYELPVENRQRVIVDLPLEVNYRISNRFLRSTGLDDVLSAQLGVEVDFNFWHGTRVGRSEKDGVVTREPAPNVLFHQGGDVEINGTVLSRRGIPLAQLRVRGSGYPEEAGTGESGKGLWAKLVLTLSIIIIARWIYHNFAMRKAEGKSKSWNLARWIAILLIALAGVRYLLLEFDFPGGIFGKNLFDPAMFADDLPGGLMRTAGDYLVSSLFLLIFVFGSVKAFRTSFGGYLERSISRGGAFKAARTLIKTVLLLVLLYAVFHLSSGIVSRVVINANPRLIGLDAGFFRLPVISLHLALLFSVSAIFVAAVFFSRLIMLWGGGPPVENAASAIASIAAFALLTGSSWILWIAAAALMALSARIFPRLKKEEVLSVIFSSFFLVLLCSLVIYETASENYGELRKGRVLEKIQGFNYPEDNWLQLVLPELCEEISSDRNIVSMIMSKKKSAAFEIWANSEMSTFNLSCVFDVYDADRKLLSRFTVGVPFEVSGYLPEVEEEVERPEVFRAVQETPQGAVHYLVGVAPVYHISGKSTGRVEIKVPYYYENTELLVRAGPMAPEIFRNVDIGSPAPRIDEPEFLLVARVEDDRVASSSTPLLAAGTKLPSEGQEWFELRVGREKFKSIVRLKEDRTGFLVGYRMAGFNESVIQWATIVSLYIILAAGSLAALYLLRMLPFFSSVTPAVTISGGLSFKRKLLLSFLFVSILPVALMGIFSGRYIRYRFNVEGEREALTAAKSAEAFLEHSVRTEAEAFAGSRLFSVGEGEGAERNQEVSDQPGGRRYAILNGEGELLEDRYSSLASAEETAAAVRDGKTGRVSVVYREDRLYGGTVVKIGLNGGGGGYLLYMRHLDDEFIRNIAGGMGDNINIYYKGDLQASSERELFTGGLLNPILSPEVFADVALGRARSMVLGQSLGDYSYKVASFAIPSFIEAENAVLSVPLLYQATLVEKEILKSYALITGLLALIFSTVVTIGVFLAGKIFTPISVLSDGTKRIIKGDLEFRLEAEAPDEIGDLVNSFNSMTAALSDARRKLLERQRYLSAVLDNVATGVVSADSGGRIVTVNPSGEKILNLSKEDLIGKKPGEAGGEGLESFFALFSGDSEEIREKEITLVSERGSRTLKTVVASLYEGGERLGTVVVFDDLTELIKTKKLSAWVEMARQIAHEVKNPLTPIKLSVQLMQRAYQENSNKFGEIFESGVSTVIQQTEILRRIVSEFSSFGKVTDLKLEAFPLPRFVEDIVSSYRGTEGIRVRFGGCDPCRVTADREALRKILVNLIENALEAMSDGGEVTLSCRRAEGMAEIRVVDSGCGLPPEVEERLFEPYFSTKTTGTGLGLAICQSLVREMGGGIFIRNREDRPGVEALVRVPLAGGGDEKIG